MMHGGGGHGGRGNFDEDEILGKAYDARLMRRLLGYLRPYRGLVIVALLIIMVTQGVVAIFGDIVVIGTIAIVLLVLDFRLALVTFAALPLLIWLTMYFRRIMRDSFRSIRIRLARINAYLNENLSGMAIVQLFTRERASFQQFDDLNTDLLNANRRQIRAMSMFFPAVGFTRAATSAALFVA